METKLKQLTEKAKRNSKMQFTSLVHYLNEEFLKTCYEELKRKTAAGVDRVTVEEYGLDLDGRIKSLGERMKANAYHPQAVRRTYIPKADGSKRMLGVPTVEDRIVQKGVSKILSAVYEGYFLDVSYGFRPNRSMHQAIKRVDMAIMTKPVRWVADIDIEGFFDNVSHYWMKECLNQRIKDPNLLRLIVRFLKAGVMEEGKYEETDKGTPQGGNLSPVLSNIFLHYILDLWFEQKIKAELKGYAEHIRYCDDFIVVFERQDEAEMFMRQLKDRLGKFGLKIKESKSRIIEFGRKPWEEAQRRGNNKPGTFDFLGFTHYCDRTRQGGFKLNRKTSRKKLMAKLNLLNIWMGQVRNTVPLEEWWQILHRKLLGHYRYYGISGNSRELKNYHSKSIAIAYKWVNRRSQKRSYSWDRFRRYLQWNPLPLPRIYYNLYASVS